MKLTAFALSVTILLASCSGDPNAANKEASDAANSSLPGTPMTWSQAKQHVGIVRVGWISSFRDSTLTRLVNEAQARNPDIRAAAAKVQSSQALARQAGAALAPQLNLNAGGGRSGSGLGGSSNNLNLGLQASWEIDLWGRLRSGRQAAANNAQAAVADYRYSQHSLAASVARAYFLAIDSQRQESLAQQNLKALAENQRIVAARRAAGESDRGDISLINSDVASAKASLIAAQGSKRDSLRALELLLGRYPGADIQVRTSLPPVPSPPGAGVPSQLLERRPDLIAAERRIAAAINNVNKSKAARLPSISLTGSGGGSSNALNTLTNPGNIAWQAASSLLVPLADGGVRKAQIQADKANQRAAVNAYASAALKAFGDVEKSLDQGTIIRQRRSLIAQSLADAKSALDVAEKNYKAGETDLFNVLQLRQKVNRLEASKITLERAQLDQIVGLNLALGGSWK